MPKPSFIELPDCDPIPILYEDRLVMAMDKPRGWMLVPVSWQKTSRNLQAAINSSIAARNFWSRSRSIRFLRHIHRLAGDTSGILLFARSPGALETCSRLFESRQMQKTYLAAVEGNPRGPEWSCRLPLAPDPRQIGRMKVDPRAGKEAETHFRALQKQERLTLVEAWPVTGRTHQIRVHLAEAGLPIIGDELYGRMEAASSGNGPGFRESRQGPRLKLACARCGWSISILSRGGGLTSRRRWKGFWANMALTRRRDEAKILFGCKRRR